MTAKIAVNGFGRIGRMACRKALMDSELEVVAINASYPAETLAHLLKYDSVQGTFTGEVTHDESTIYVDGHPIQLLQSRDPLALPWGELEIDIVIEATGKFKERETAGYHLEAGAKKVIITAPGKGEDLTVVMGVNESEYDDETHHVISNASCTTNCLAPVVKVLDEKFGIESGMMTTVHAYTNDQKNLDNPHKDLRRARACGQSIIPTSTGAAKAISKVLPQLDGKMHGMALRVPTPNVSLVDLVVDIEQATDAAAVNAAFQQAAQNELKGILSYNDGPFVSIDYNGNDHSSIVDGLSTIVLNDKQVKVLAWYDNEWGYSCRVIDLARHMAKKLSRNAQVS
ncbi:glyceraldehyde-3-phosphate dehydrogenase [Salsuginibacillus kocurii]|uniref:glyceraldehyde-3-phosphate dehydrogenase n=1 Tax=Salsuginibacillus kocurii TaxID=427078 RepID=UPI00037788D0|nr:glyceraldehyde-3-phosphate dehydrogenase [Salsuginibacillus kocurii]